MFPCSRGSAGSYWPTNERVMIAVVSFSSSSDVWEHKHPLFICVRFRSLTYLHPCAFPSFSSSSSCSCSCSSSSLLHLLPQATPSSGFHVGPESPSMQTEWAAFCACSGLCGCGGDQAMVGMKGNETWLCVRWAARGQLSNVSGFGLESWETEGEGEKKSPLLWLKGISAPLTCIGPGWVWVRELFTHKALGESSSTAASSLPSPFVHPVCLSVYTSGFSCLKVFFENYLRLMSCLISVRPRCDFAQKWKMI